jgi:hypothetical protein
MNDLIIVVIKLELARTSTPSLPVTILHRAHPQASLKYGYDLN